MSGDQPHYIDKFGNCIIPDFEFNRANDEIKDEKLQDKQSKEHGSNGEHGPGGSIGWITTIDDVDMESQTVLPKDKKYIPTTEKIYGENVKTLVINEDEQPFECDDEESFGDKKFWLIERDVHDYLGLRDYDGCDRLKIDSDVTVEGKKELLAEDKISPCLYGEKKMLQLFIIPLKI